MNTQAATPETIKLVGPSYTSEPGEIVVDINDVGGTVADLINGVDEDDTLVVVLPGVPADFEPVVFTDPDVHLSETFIALKGTVNQIFGQPDVTFLFAAQWESESSTMPTFSLGIKAPSFSLAALNPDWKLPVTDQPDIADAFVVVATGAQDFPADAPDEIKNFYAEDMSEDHTLDAGAAFQGTLALRSVLGDNATEGLFNNVNQTVTLKASITVGDSGDAADDVVLLNQTGGEAPTDTPVDVNVHFEAAMDLDDGSAVGFPGYVTATGEWKLALDVSTADKKLSVSGSGELTISDDVVAGGVVLGVSIAVTHAPDGTEVVFETELKNEIENVFGTSLTINDAKLKLEWEKSGTTSAAKAALMGKVTIGSATAEASASIKTGAAGLEQAELSIDLANVDLAALFSWAATSLGFENNTLDSTLAGLELTTTELRVTLKRGASGSTTEFAARSTVTYNSLAADLVAYAVDRGGQPGSGFTVGLRLYAAGGGSLTLGDLIPGIGDPFETFEIPDAAIGYSNIGHQWNVAPTDNSVPTPPEIVSFLERVYFPDSTDACKDIAECKGRRANFDVPAGGFLISAFQMPESFDDMLDTFGIEKGQPVLLKGTAGLFGSTSNLAIEAALPPMVPASPSDGSVGFFESGQLSFGVRIQTSGGVGAEAYIKGKVVVRVEDATEVCGFDRLGFLVETTLSIDALGVSFDILGALTPAGPAPGGACENPTDSASAWASPFGQQWLDINGVALQFGLKATATGVDLKIGFAGSITIGDTDLQAAVSLAITPIPNPPFVIVKPLGFRVASGSGVTFQQLVTFYNDNISPGAPIPLGGGWSDFDIAVKNLEFSYAVEDAPALCLFTGIRVRGYLYLGSDLVGYTPAGGEPCVLGNTSAVPMPPPGAGGGCALGANKDHGCFAGVDISISPATGLSASAEIGPIELGPVSTEQTFFSIVANSSTIQLKFSGGLSIENVFKGYAEVEIKPDGFHFLSYLGLFPEPPPALFQAEVAGSASFSMSNPTFILDARMQSNFGAAMEPVVRPIAQVFATTVHVVNGYLAIMNDPNLGFDAMIDYVFEVPSKIIEVNPELANDPLLKTLSDIGIGIRDARRTAASLGIPLSLDSLINFVLQGQYVGTPAVYGGEEDLWIFGTACVPFSSGDRCTLIPAIGFQIPGICPSLVQVPNCNAAGLKTVMVNGLNSVMAATLGIDTVTMQQHLTRIANNFQERPIIFDVACAGFHLELGKGEEVSNRIDVYIKLILLGNDVVFGPLSWDFNAPFGENLGGVVNSLGATLFGTPKEFDCGLAGNAARTVMLESPPSDVAQTSSPIVAEGNTFTVNGQFNPGSTEPGDTQTVKLTWPDGSQQSINVPIGTNTFTATRTFNDDNPTGTPFDRVNIPVEVTNSRTGSAYATFTSTIQNVAPTITDLTVTPAEVDEGSPMTLSGTFTDPSPDDTFTVTVQWGDGRQDTLTVPAGERSFQIAHTYADDPKNADDTYRIDVRVRDDDSGQGTSSTNAVVRNVAPTLDEESIQINVLEADGETVVAADVTDVDEQQYFEVVGTFTDPGTADTHVLTIDPNDGSPPFVTNIVPTGAVSATRDFRVLAMFPDDNPTATASDLVNWTFTLVDDDDGAAEPVDKSITVHNVAPRIASTTDQTVQYSDPLPAPLSVTFDDVEADVWSEATTTWTLDGGPSNPGLPADLALTAEGCVPTTVAGLPGPRTACTWTIDGIVDVQPGDYVISVTVEDDDLGVTTADLNLRVDPEDARATYTGPTLFSAVSVTKDNYADVLLRATVRDISVVPGIVPEDEHPGNITNATVTFVDRDTNVALCTTQVTQIFPDDTTTGGASCVGRLELSPVEIQKTFNIGIVVGGWYTRDDASEDAEVTIHRVNDNYTTVGGFVNVPSSAGLTPADIGKDLKPTFNPKFYYPRYDDIRGRGRLLFDSNGKAHEIEVTEFHSMGTAPGANGEGYAQLEATARLLDTSVPGRGDVLAEGLHLQVRITDASTDAMSWALWDQDGLLVSSSGWDGVEVPEVPQTRGDLVVRFR